MSLGRPVRRRSGDSGCQWLAIGMTIGFGCSLVFFLGAYIFRIIEINALEAIPTQSVAIIVTPIPVTATPQPLPPSPEPATGADTGGAAALDAVTASPEAASDTLSTAPEAATPLPSGNSSPTRLPDSAPPQATLPTISGDSTTEVASVGAGGGEIGTPVPLGGSPSPTPSLGSGAGVPEALAGLASPLVAVPGGAFTMGTTAEEGLNAVNLCISRDGGQCNEEYIQDSTPPHQVTISDFQMEIYEVSVTQYVAFLNYLLTTVPAGIRADQIGCGGQPCVLTSDQEQNSIIRFNGTAYEVVNPAFYANHPIYFVTWFGADAYCKTMGRRLPTEAEWERAARGPANSVYPWGPEWVAENANTSRSTDGGDGTRPVDSFPLGASAYGIYNMAGNVSEWVFDFYQENYYSLPDAAGPDPRGPITGSFRVVRGGGWDEVPLFSRTVHRMYTDPKRPRSSLGFRCAADAP